MKSKNIRKVAGLVVAALVGFAGVSHAQTASSTTTTTFGGTTTTTMFVPTDITGGGQFEGSFPKGSFDSYTFTLDEPRALVVELTNGFGGCPGDSIIELRRPGAPGNCQGVYGDDLPCIAFDDDSGISLCSLLVHFIAEPGEYEVRVSAYRGRQLPRYFIDVEFVEVECGNGELEVTEDCDDGNLAAGDCCSPTCTTDAPGTPCHDGVFCNGADTCTAGGSCSNHAGDPCPGPDGDGNCSETCNESVDACSGADSNGTTCQDGLFCNGADLCSGGECGIHAGNPCAGADGDGNCSESCNEAADACTAADSNGSPCDDGVFCNGADTCSGGACSQHAGNPCPGPDGDVNCAETCDETAGACTGNDPNGASCEDDLVCNGTDTCSGGLCNQHTGSPCPGVDGDSNCAESCSDSAGGCTGNDPEGAPCDDGIFCNGADTCSGGSCSVHAGSPCPGPDGDGNCAESCNEATDTCTAPDPASSPCNDGLFCNGTDTCTAGVCSGHAGSPCPGADGDANCAEQCDEAADSCTIADPDGSPCVDALFCNGPDTCLAGFCSQHAGNPCPGPDGDNNCAETCNETIDSCAGADPNGSACNDNIFCNGPDTCLAGACSQHAGNPCPGADGDIDCSEMCNEATDSCTANDPDGTVCEDFLFCNGSDTCQSGSCTQHTGNPCVGADGDANCSESCNEASETCTGPDVNGSPCTDSLFCNGADSCMSGACSQHSGDPCPGPDVDANCNESCDEAVNDCVAPDASGSACNDGLFCNGADSCMNGSCSAHAGNPCGLPDGDGNCAEACSEASDTCTAPDPNGSACDDGVFCNGADTCMSGACSQHGGDPCPGADGDLNCRESCNEGAAACSAADPNGSACEDGLVCNGADTCIGGLCNGHTGAQCPGADGDGNCAESCSDSEGGCAGPDPQGSPCDDGIFCNGPDSCSGGSCSVHAGNPCPGPDGDIDCSEQCDEASDGCTANEPNGTPCDDALFCNGADNCSGGDCSTHAGSPCDDGDTCTLDECDEEGNLCANTTLDPCPEPFVCGDVTGDGEVKASDALAVLRAAVGGNQCAEELCVCDANGNGTLTAPDALLVLRVAVGVAIELQCPC
ncbi:MAG: dockerin type I repeat-containing protein [Candidatus Binatia bacterium]